jgi:hypothetical protein
MPDEGTSHTADMAGQIEKSIFEVLVDRDEQRPWSVAEIEQHMGGPFAIADSLMHLHRSGLIHRCGDFVWATRVALAAGEFAG